MTCLFFFYLFVVEHLFGMKYQPKFLGVVSVCAALDPL